jgi:pyridoxamine 5'-phosphate oxidase
MNRDITIDTPTDLQDLRKSYELGELLEGQVAANPLSQLQTWLTQAITAQVLEPNAMTLATVAQDAAGVWRPSSRIVLVKGVDEAGLTWFTNYDSRKGRELAAHPYASLQFHWVAQERQVRLEGTVEKLTDAESDAYYHSRPLGSRIGAWASPQSQVISGRAVLETAATELTQSLGNSPKRPANWGGYRLRPDAVEFWQGRPNRLHDRLRYRWLGGVWVIERLAP